MKRQQLSLPVALYALCVCSGFTVSSSALLLIGARRGTRISVHDSAVTGIEPELVENCHSELQNVLANRSACEAGLESIREASHDETHRYVDSELEHVMDLGAKMGVLDSTKADIEDSRILQDSLHKRVQDELPHILGLRQLAAAEAKAQLEASVAQDPETALMDEYLQCSSDLDTARRAATACAVMTVALRMNQANHIRQYQTADAHLQAMLHATDKAQAILDRALSNTDADNQRMSAHADALSSVTPLTQHR